MNIIVLVTKNYEEKNLGLSYLFFENYLQEKKNYFYDQQFKNKLSWQHIFHVKNNSMTKNPAYGRHLSS